MIEKKRATISGVMFLIVLALVATVHTTFAHLSLDNAPELNSSPDAVSQGYIPHDATSIDGNEDFFSPAALEGWNCSGTENDSIIIEGYSITGSLHLFRAITHMILSFMQLSELAIVFRVRVNMGIS